MESGYFFDTRQLGNSAGMCSDFDSAKRQVASIKFYPLLPKEVLFEVVYLLETISKTPKSK